MFFFAEKLVRTDINGISGDQILHREDRRTTASPRKSEARDLRFFGQFHRFRRRENRWRSVREKGRRWRVFFHHHHSSDERIHLRPEQWILLKQKKYNYESATTMAHYERKPCGSVRFLKTEHCFLQIRFGLIVVCFLFGVVLPV